MKATTLIALGALLAPCAFGQDAAPAAGAPNRSGRGGAARQMPAELVKQFDKDGDGKLNEEETTAMRADMTAKREARQKANLEKFDANKDGKLDEAETKTMRETQQKERLEKYDTNKDGKIDQEESAKIPASERFMGGPGGAGGAGGRQPGGRGGRGGAPGGAPGAPPAPAPAPAPEQPK